LEKVQKGFLNLFKQTEKGIKLATSGIVDIGKVAGSEFVKLMDLQHGSSMDARKHSTPPPLSPQLSVRDDMRMPHVSESARLESPQFESDLSPSPARPPRRYPDASSDSASSRGKSSVPRSASDIRSAYGRDNRVAASAANNTAAIMGDNVARLKERQERLERMEERGADLEKSAADFAAMAKQLNQAANKPWWKIG